MRKHIRSIVVSVASTASRMPDEPWRSERLAKLVPDASTWKTGIRSSSCTASRSTPQMPGPVSGVAQTSTTTGGQRSISASSWMKASSAATVSRNSSASG